MTIFLKLSETCRNDAISWFSTSPNTGNDFYHSVSFGRDKLLKIGFTFEIHCFMEYFCYTLHFYSAKVLFLWFPTNIWEPFFFRQRLQYVILHLQRLPLNTINSVRLPCLFGSRTELIMFLPLFSSSLHPPFFRVCNAEAMSTSICDAPCHDTRCKCGSRYLRIANAKEREFSE